MNYDEKKPMNYEDKPMHGEEKTEKKPSYGAQPEGKKPKEAAPKGEEQKKGPMHGNGEPHKMGE